MQQDPLHFLPGKARLDQEVSAYCVPAGPSDDHTSGKSMTEKRICAGNRCSRNSIGDQKSNEIDELDHKLSLHDQCAAVPALRPAGQHPAH